MGIHADDVAFAIRQALKDEDVAHTQSEIEWIPNPDMDWKNRDGHLAFEVVGRDWFRAFRITVEAIPVGDFKGAEVGTTSAPTTRR